MNKIVDFFSKWAFLIVVCVIAVALLFALGCCIYTAITNPFVGSIGVLGVLVALAVAIGWIFVEIKEG